jgi:transposase
MLLPFKKKENGSGKTSSGLLCEIYRLRLSLSTEFQMTTTISTQSNRQSKSQKRKNSKRKQTLQKASGVIAPRVKKVGGDKFAIVCVDPAKARSEWMMADYYGNVLIPANTVEHQPIPIQLVIAAIKQAQQQHQIQDMIVTIERTGNYHLPVQRAFKRAGLEVRIVHPFATKQFRLPADAGNKTDATDLAAQHRAAVAGFGLCELPLPPNYQQLQLQVRHRRDLVEKSSALACQIKEHLNLTMPRYAKLFSNFFSHQAALTIAVETGSPEQVVALGVKGMGSLLRQKKLLFQSATTEKILAWAQQAVQTPALEATSLRHAIWTDLYQLHELTRLKINVLEREIAGSLATTPYIRLLAIPGINVVSAADFAGEMGPISHYANANAITGRSGLYPSRYQSDQTDNAGGIVRTSNRRLRAAIMRIADNLTNLNYFFQARSALQLSQKEDKRAIRVKTAKTFSRLAMACVAGDQPLKHPCCRDPNSIIEKLRAFHYQHGTTPDVALVDLQNAVGQLPLATQGLEAEAVSVSLENYARGRRGPTKLGELLPLILARLNLQTPPSEAFAETEPGQKNAPAANIEDLGSAASD